jgi:predicted dehydrogenase
VQVVAAATLGDQDNLTATLSYPDGSLASISYLTDGDPRLPKERIEIFGEGKAACFENFSEFVLWQSGRSTKKRVRSLDKGQKAELDAFISAVRTGNSMPIGVESLLATTSATMAAQESIAANGPIIVSAGLDSAVREIGSAVVARSI